jgi:c-di-GMP-binding flagellar brake protein YcgR
MTVADDMTIAGEETNWTAERRLVTRFTVPEVPLTLSYQRRGVFRARSTASLYAVMADVSDIGAQIVAPRTHHLVLRSAIDVELAGDLGTAIVRDVQVHSETEARYGVEFVRMSPRFRARILALADRAKLERQRV